MLVKNMRQFEKKVLRKEKRAKHFLMRQLTGTTEATTCLIRDKFMWFP